MYVQDAWRCICVLSLATALSTQAAPDPVVLAASNLPHQRVPFMCISLPSARPILPPPPCSKNGYELSYNQEIVGLGIANFAGAMFNSYTTTGSFSRSAVNNSSGGWRDEAVTVVPHGRASSRCGCRWTCCYMFCSRYLLVVVAAPHTPLCCCLLLPPAAAGAKTQLAGFITSMVVMFVLLFLTKVFELLPYNTMAAIIIAGVMGLVEFDTAIYLMKVCKGEGGQGVFVCVCGGGGGGGRGADGGAGQRHLPDEGGVGCGLRSRA